MVHSSDNLKLNRNLKKGFTLVELLIATTIIVILASVSFWAYQNRGEGGIIIARASDMIVANAENIKEMSLSAKDIYGEVPEGGYGIHFDANHPYSFKVFADCNGNHILDNSGSPCNGHKELIQEISLEKRVKINSIPSNTLNVTFEPPAPDVYFYSNIELSSSKVCVNLVFEPNPNFSKKVCFNKSGLIYEE